MEIKKLHVEPAYQVVSNELRKHILEGSLKPGDRLPGEIDLATRFGVNRSTVREGIRQLESDGLVRRENRKRLVVNVPNHADFTPRAASALIMGEVTFGALWDVCSVLEPLAARLAAIHATEAEIEQLRENLSQTVDVVKAGGSPGRLDLEFHTLVSQAAHNPALSMAREPVGSLLYPAFETLHPQLPQASPRLIEAHTRIVDAIAERDPAEAENWARKHIQDLRRGWGMSNLPLDQRIKLPHDI